MLLGSLSDSLLVLLTFDAERAPIIRGAVELGLYSGPYRLVASRIYEHLDRFKKPPADHLPDLFNEELSGKQAELYTGIFENIAEAKQTVNPEFVMTTLQTFIKRQSLRSAAVNLAKVLQRDNEEALDEAEKIMAAAGQQALTVFDPGTRLSDARRALRFIDTQGTGSFATGIPELDKRGFGPTRKELWLLIANTKSGKSWALTQLAKAAAMHHFRVVHITLEMSEQRAAQRYFQAFFAISKRNEPQQITTFTRDTLGRITGFNDARVTPKYTLDNPKIRSQLQHEIKRWRTRLLDKVIVREFPTGQLTVPQLSAYLDNLEVTEKFAPDLLIVDYPDLMKLDKAEPRFSLDELYKNLRGLAVERNIALAVVSQSHRGAARAKLVRADNVAEAYVKTAHADTSITYTQTMAEHKLGLARLHVAAGRSDADKFTVVISQNYAMGAFVVDSALMAGSSYWNLIPKGDDDD